MECNNAEPEEEQPSNNSGEPEQGEELPMPESEINPIDDSTVDPPSMEPIRIGARLPTRDRRHPTDWWKPWEPTTPQKDPSPNEGMANSAHEPHGKHRNYAEAMKHQDASSWETAAQEEMTNHLANKTWSLVPRPKDGNVIGSRWVFRLKYNTDGSVERHKARLVAKGYSQRPGLEYLEIFAPTVRMQTVRTILALAAIDDLHLRSIDISHAYLNGKMDLQVYMEQPEGFAQGNPRETVCLLDKALYGAKQGGRQWNKNLHEALTKL